MAAALAQSPTAAELARATLAEQVALLTRCVDLGGVTYCLNQGFRPVPLTPAEIDLVVAEGLAVEGKTAVPGDLTLLAIVRQRAAMSDAERLRAESAELAEASAGVASAKRYAMG